MPILPIDWIAKLQHLLHTLAFSLAVAALQYAFQPDRPWQVPLVYSLCIGGLTWGLIDFGRHLFPSSRETGWPHGWTGALLVSGGILGAYVLGTVAADVWFGWSSWDVAPGRNPRVAGLLITVCAGLAGFSYFHARGRADYLERRMAEEHQLAAEARLKLLEAQLEPHMLFNTLANLRALVATEPPRALVMLDHLVAFLRATLQASRATTHPLADEFARVRHYLELMAVRMGPRLAYTLDLPPALAALPVPTLLLQPLVENAIRHGLEPRIAGGHITVCATTEAQPGGRRLRLSVQDDGVGLAAGAQGPGDGAGFGLVQVRERLAALYGAAARLDIAPGAGGGVCVRADWPLGAAT